MSTEHVQDRPTQIGRYEIVRHEAEGGMGDVYLARDPLMKRRVAIKLLKRVYSDDPSIRRRFTQEAEAVAALEHDAIVPIYDFGDHNGQQYFVMRYVAGGTLRDRLQQGPLPLREAARVIGRVSEALDAAHRSALVHRDVKPANILFDTDGRVFLSDFGIVQTTEPIDETGTMLLGTPQYLSPEQAEGDELDLRSDVYSLGVVAFHCIVGEPPFTGKTPMMVAMAHVMEPAPAISSRAENLPPIIDAVFARVLAKKREDRYCSTTEFAKDLRDIASGRWYLVKLSSSAATAETKAPPLPSGNATHKPRTTGETGEWLAAENGPFSRTTPFSPATRPLRRIRRDDETR